MKNQISVLSLDLGSQLGWCKCVCAIRPEIAMNVIDHGTIDLDLLSNKYQRINNNELFSKHRTRMVVYEEALRKLTRSMKFDAFVVEDIFCMPSRITAFRSLVNYMETFERLVNTELHHRIYTIPPTLIKKHIANYGLQDKVQVQQSIIDNKKITIKKTHDMSFHASDAVAGAWAFLQVHLVSPL